MATVDIKGVRKTYPGSSVEVIKGIDLSVEDGEFLVLLGPSGCGKSTLLRMVAGLERVSAGNILIGDRDVTDLEPKDRDIAMVFQNYALYPHMSVFDNMAYGLKIKGIPRVDIDRRVRDAARILEIEPFLDRKPRQLSGGQRQRVAMGRAIVREPKVFLFDEPLSNLDAKLRTQMRVEIKRLQSRLGVTALYVTHDQVEAMTMADRIVVLNAGVAEQVDTPLSVYARPATLFVAGFIGSPAMNMLKGRVDEDGIHLSLPGGQRLKGPGVAGMAGREVIVGIRPENLADPSQADPEHRLDLEIDLVEALGADSIVHGRIGDGLGLIARMPGTVTSRPGERVILGVAEADIRLFDPQSGRALA